MIQEIIVIKAIDASIVVLDRVLRSAGRPAQYLVLLSGIDGCDGKMVWADERQLNGWRLLAKAWEKKRELDNVS